MEPFLGEIRLFSFSFVPQGWAECAGQELPIAQNQALFSLLGTRFGGDGMATFNLPDLRGRVPVHMARTVDLGTARGSEGHALALDEMPAHTHEVSATGESAAGPSPVGAIWARQEARPFATGVPTTELRPDSIRPAGDGRAHENRQPWLSVSFCIAVAGFYPLRP